MNRFDNLLGKKQQAKIKYLDNEFQMISPGDFVICAITGAQINVDQLKYWSVERQEPYANAAAAMQAQMKLESD